MELGRAVTPIVASAGGVQLVDVVFEHVRSLGNAYMKLEIGGRERLAAALEQDDGE